MAKTPFLHKIFASRVLFGYSLTLPGGSSVGSNQVGTSLARMVMAIAALSDTVSASSVCLGDAQALGRLVERSNVLHYLPLLVSLSSFKLLLFSLSSLRLLLVSLSSLKLFFPPHFLFQIAGHLRVLFFLLYSTCQCFVLADRTSSIVTVVIGIESIVIGIESIDSVTGAEAAGGLPMVVRTTSASASSTTSRSVVGSGRHHCVVSCFVLLIV